jgi:predicted amidohydrolase
MRVRALENRAFAVTANRIGEEARGGESLRFTGESQIVSPRGEVLAKSSPDAEEAVAVDIDPAEALDKRVTPRNHLLSDRRPDLYDLLSAHGIVTKRIIPRASACGIIRLLASGSSGGFIPRAEAHG